MHNLEVMGVLPKLKGSNDKMFFKDMSKFSNERTNNKNKKEQRNSRAFRRYEWKVLKNRSCAGG